MAGATRPVGRAKKDQQALVLGRRESIYDSEYQVGGAALLGQIQVYVNFAAFKQTGGTAALKKQFYRDTNLSASQGALPKNYRFGAYRWRTRFRALSSALSSTSVFLEEMNRYRELAALTIRINRADYMTAMADDLVSWADSKYIASPTTAAGTNIFIVPATDHDGRVLEVNRQPFILGELEQFSVNVDLPGSESAVLFTLTKDCFVTPIFDGVLIRPTN